MRTHRGSSHDDATSPAEHRAGSPQDAWVYLLRCADGSLYCGWTVDLDRRLEAHSAGRASRFTRSRLPVELALALPMPDRGAARRAEARIKALSRADKLALVATAPRRPGSPGRSR